MFQNKVGILSDRNIDHDCVLTHSFALLVVLKQVFHYSPSIPVNSTELKKERRLANSGLIELLQESQIIFEK